MAIGNPFALLDGYDDVNADALVAKVKAEMAAAVASAPVVTPKEEPKPVADYSVRGERGGYGQGHGRGRGRGFYGNGRFGNNGGAGWDGGKGGRGYNGGRGRGGYGGYGVFRGGRGRGFDRPYGGRNGAESKDSGIDLKGENASAGEIPKTIKVVAKDVESEKENADQVVSKDLSQTVDEKEEKRKQREEEHERKKKERLEKEREEDAKKMTLAQYYSKVVVEKKKALEPFLQVEERKVVVDVELEQMQLIGKRKEEIFVKLGSEKEKPQKKKEGKLKKSLSLDEFLKPVGGGQRYRPVRNNPRGASADDQDRDSNRSGRGLANGTGRDPQVEDRNRPHVRGFADHREQYPRGCDFADRRGQYPQFGGRGRGHGRGRGFGRRVEDPVKIEDPRQSPDLEKTSKVNAKA